MGTATLDINVGAVVLFSSYILLGFYLMTILLQRITYTFNTSPTSLTVARFMLFCIILMWCIFTNLLYLYSCFIDTETAQTNKYYKYAFYIEFYFQNIVWSLSVIFMAFSLKFKRDAPLNKMYHDNNKKPQPISKQSKGYSSVDNDRDAPPPDPDKVRQQRKLDINDVDLRIQPKNKNQLKSKPAQQKNNMVQHLKPEQKYDVVDSVTKTQSFSFSKPETVYDNNKTHQNMCIFLIYLYIAGTATLLFTIIWYGFHFEDYNKLFEYKSDWKLPRYQFPYYHYENDTVTIITRGCLSIFLALQAGYLLKEFRNNTVAPVLIINLIIYWILYCLFIANNLVDVHGHNVFLFVQPILYYIIFFCLHIADAQRDEIPLSQSVIVNMDKLELFYSLWPAKPYKTSIAPNIFCFGPSPRLKNPPNSSIILLGGWGNIKEDYNQIAYSLSQHGRNVIVIDYRGVGETGLGSQTNHDFYTAEQYADDIMHLIKQLFPHPNDNNKNNNKLLDDNDESDSNSSDYDSKDEFNRNNNNNNNVIKGERVWIVGLSMGGNIALQCALHPKAKQYIRGIAVCSGHAGSYLLQKGIHFESYGNQILTGNALHYGWCHAQKLYIEYAHSEQFRSKRYNRCCLRIFYSWRLSTHPYYCCNCSRGVQIRDKHDRNKRLRSNKNAMDKEPSYNRGVSKFFSSLSLSIRGGVEGKHAIVEGIERQTDVAEEGFNVATIIENISIPTLICNGKQDTIIDSKTAELLKKAIGQNAWNEEFEYGGHNFWFEDIDDFVGRIQEWMTTEEDYDQGNDDRTESFI